jgi:hypothetical protein
MMDRARRFGAFRAGHTAMTMDSVRKTFKRTLDMIHAASNASGHRVAVSTPKTIRACQVACEEESDSDTPSEATHKTAATAVSQTFLPDSTQVRYTLSIVE